MPIKHQSKSYRNKNKILYICWEDCPTKNMAICQVDNFKRNGLRAFFENGDKGAYYRVFVEAHKGREKGLI